MGNCLRKFNNILQRFWVEGLGQKTLRKKIEVKSWIDYFMLSNVYIVGFGLDLSELDLWGLINCKKRHFPETKIVLYKPDITLEQRLIAESYNIEIKSDGLVNENYKDYYQKVYEELKIKF